jgi:hypothetical protein
MALIVLETGRWILSYMNGRSYAGDSLAVQWVTLNPSFQATVAELPDTNRHPRQYSRKKQRYW